MVRSTSPPRFARFLIWVTTRREYKEDALIAFDEMYARTVAEFGPKYAWTFAVWQGVRSVPYGLRGITLQLLRFLIESVR